LAKRLTKKQKDEIIKSFTNGKTVEFLSQIFSCTKLTIIRNLKSSLGESTYKELLNNKEAKSDFLNEESKNTKDLKIELNLEVSGKDLSDLKKDNEKLNEVDFLPLSSFVEITPIDYEIDNEPRKELSSVPISEIDFPKIVYMIVDKNIELEIKLLKDYPEWNFLPLEDLNRKTIEIYHDLKIAKRFCNKEQKVIKVPNTNVFRIAAALLLSRGISRIICAEKLIAL
tara:strand:+ start:165 stop:845 length:681 start_codon:yes stop_codon:yes gene_type:complete